MSSLLTSAYDYNTIQLEWNSSTWGSLVDEIEQQIHKVNTVNQLLCDYKTADRQRQIPLEKVYIWFSVYVNAYLPLKSTEMWNRKACLKNSHCYNIFNSSKILRELQLCLLMRTCLFHTPQLAGHWSLKYGNWISQSHTWKPRLQLNICLHCLSKGETVLQYIYV